MTVHGEEIHFIGTGWGYHSNAAARHLAMAFYLDPAGDYGELSRPGALFPPRGQDLFGDYLEDALEAGLPPALTKYVKKLYWVAED